MLHHSGVKFLRPLCRKGVACPYRHSLATVEANRKHVMDYAHPMPEWTLPVCAVYGHNTIRHLMEDSPSSVEVDFKSNATDMIKRVKDFLPFKGSTPQPKVLEQVADFLKQSRPVHRLSLARFGKVAQSGFLASHHFLTTSSTDVQFAAQLPSVVEPLCDYPEHARGVSEFVDAVVKHFLVKFAFEQVPKKQAPQNQGQPVIERNALGGKQAEVHRLAAEVARSKACLHFLPKPVITKMEAELENYLAGMRQLQDAADAAAAKGENPDFGIGYDCDRYFETNKMNFAILGPHTLRKYGEDQDDNLCEGVHLIFESSSIYHPDVFLTPMAATFYNSGAGDGHRPWSPTGKNNGAERSYELMLKEKLHPSALRCFEALAWDFIARAAKIVNSPDDYKHSIPDGCDVLKAYKPLSQVTFQDFMTYWKVANAHYVVECHLPYLTPLTLVEKVVVSERSFLKLPVDDQNRVDAIFGSKVVKTPTDASSKTQYDLASSPLPWPDLPPAFHWTLMAVKTAEVVLPETLPHLQRSRIFFRTSVPNFTVKLAKTRNAHTLTSPFSITVMGERCYTSGGSCGNQSLARFNEHLRSNSHSVMYCIDVENGRVTFKHAGASQVLNSQKLGPLFVASGLKFVSFSAQGFIQFTDVRVVIGESHEDLYEHERDVEIKDFVHMPRASLEAIKVDKGKEEDTDHWSLTRAARVAQKGLMKMFGGGGSCAKPVCSMGLSCRAAYGTKKEQLQEDDKRHLKEQRHLCLHGRSCNDRGTLEHEEEWMHLDKEVCPEGDWCMRLTDVQHRAHFHHWGKWDFLLPCRDGLRCVVKHPKHFEQYHHKAMKYVITDDEVRLQATSVGADDGSNTANSGGICSGVVTAAASSDCAGYQAPQRAPNKLGFDDVQGSVQEDMDDMGDIYNDDAIQGHYGDAKFDRFGCPIGDFDLAKDGSFKGYKVLIGMFYHGENLPQYLKALTVPQLEKKGFEVTVCDCMGTFTGKLKTERFHVAWILSSDAPGSGDMEEFVAEVRRFHEAGRGLMVWGDNHPYYVHANSVLDDLFNFKLMGSTPGGKDLVPGDAGVPGCFDRSFKVCAGIECLNEGVTICYPTQVRPGWRVFGTSSDKQTVLLAKEASSEVRGKPGTGRVIVDNGFTKLYESQWNTAGTPRYVSNCTAWLVLRERFRFPGWEFS